MKRLKTIKIFLACSWALGASLLVGANAFRGSASAVGDAGTGAGLTAAQKPVVNEKQVPPGDYVGGDTCAACHDAQHQNFSKTIHARLGEEKSWKGKVVGCESCHGPGREHVEAGGDPTKIVSFHRLGAKEGSETCLKCHAGREEHNAYRRGEHWRNDVGCADCHFAHAPDPAPPRAESHTLISERTRKSPDSSVLRMLKGNEAQLCLRCHEEQKSDFTRPFRHKVLEGMMKCSDCHNPHGGYELKQTRLANFSASDAVCAKCHTDKAGPFIYEHGPLTVEGCSSCHTPHGSTNTKLLKRAQVFQLCIECHTNAHAVGLGGEELAPNTPSFHNLTTARIQNCTTCHTFIHGSNSHPFFFR